MADELETKLFSPCDSCPHRDVPHDECLSCAFTEAQARLAEIDSYVDKAIEYFNLEDGHKDAVKELRIALSSQPALGQEIARRNQKIDLYTVTS